MASIREHTAGYFRLARAEMEQGKLDEAIATIRKGLVVSNIRHQNTKLRSVLLFLFRFTECECTAHISSLFQHYHHLQKKNEGNPELGNLLRKCKVGRHARISG